MIFEVINDRGVRLKPYEILKGKLLGQIDKDQLNQLGLNDLWDKQVNMINQDSPDALDDFFIYYLRAKYADSIHDARKIDKNYHRYIFTSEMNEHLKLHHNPKEVMNFLCNTFKYYTDLYGRILQYRREPHRDYIHVYYNRLTEMDNQFILILSACKLDDPQEDEKIRTVAYEVDRLFSLLQECSLLQFI